MKRLRKKREVAVRVCPNCAFLSHRPIEECPRCGARMATDREENVADKTTADSFPASDPPSY